MIIEKSSADDLKEVIGSEARSLFAILDACDEPRVPDKVQELGNDLAVSLYRGAAQRDYWSIAPYLVIVDEPVLDWIVENLWKDPWGIFAVADASLEDMRKHFRKFLLVEGPEGDELYFRYYDPRVLPTYLATCVVEEVGEFFGDLECFACSDVTTGELNWIRRNEKA